MVAFRRSKAESSENLLASKSSFPLPAPNHQQYRRSGLFRKNNNSNKKYLSDEEPDRRNGAPPTLRAVLRTFGRKDEAEYEEHHNSTHTPPITPLTPLSASTASPPARREYAVYQPSSSPVRAVAFGNKSAGHLSQNQHSQQNQQRNLNDGLPPHPRAAGAAAVTAEDGTVVSELTYPLEMAQQHQAHLEKARYMMAGGGGRTDGTASTAPQSVPDDYVDPEDSIVTRVLGLVEMTCAATFHELQVMTGTDDKKLQPKHSFSPEWGVPPKEFEEEEEEEDEEEDDDNDDDVNDGNDGGTLSTYNSGEITATNGYAIKTIKTKRNESNDFFEMVLVDPNSDNSPGIEQTLSHLISVQKFHETSPKSPEGVLGIAKRNLNEKFEKEEEKKDDDFRRGRSPPRSTTNPNRPKAGLSPPKPPRIPNPAAVLIRKARTARERKKQAEKEKRYKKLLSSLKEQYHGPLSPVVEEELNSNTEAATSAAASDHVVRVPGIQAADAYVKASDLIGSECVEVDKETKAAAVMKRKYEENNLLAAQHMPDDDQLKEDVANNLPENNVSWRSILGLKRKGQTNINNNNSNNSGINNNNNNNGGRAKGTERPVAPSTAAAAPASPTVRKKANESPSSPKVTNSPTMPNSPKSPKSTTTTNASAAKTMAKDPLSTPPRSNRATAASSAAAAADEKKRLWKEVVDKSTGRTYYYHRITRQTTWSKPPSDQIVGKDFKEMEEEIKVILDRRLPEDLDPATKAKKEEIARILTAMAPPSSEAVDRLVTKYEGREDELLNQLKNLNESKPFDEPVQNAPAEPPKPLKHRQRSGTYSVISGKSGKASEQTPLVTNTRAHKSLVDAIQESSEAGSTSSSHLVPKPSPDRTLSTYPSVPSNVPVPRRRELRVEEFASDRVKAETFEVRRPLQRPPRAPARPNAITTGKPVAASPYSSVYDTNYLGDSELTDRERDTESQDNSGVQDSISALSEPDLHTASYRKEAVYDSRRRALNEAIANEDWDLAAALSEGLRSLQANQAQPKAHKQKEWKQSELDRFISENDWDAVAGYIAQVRAQAKVNEPKNRRDKKLLQQQQLHTSPRGSGVSANNTSSEYKSFGRVHSEDSGASSPRRKFGAKSQLQHSGLHSVSSWESSTSYDSEEYTTDSYSEEERRRRKRIGQMRDGKKAFAC